MPEMRPPPGVHGYVGSYIGVEVAQLVDVVRDTHRADLGDPHGTVGIDEAGVDVLAGDVHHLSPLGNSHVGSDRHDQSVLEEDRAVLDDPVGHRVDGGPP